MRKNYARPIKKPLIQFIPKKELYIVPVPGIKKFITRHVVPAQLFVGLIFDSPQHIFILILYNN